MIEHIVPTSPGWWWRMAHGVDPFVVAVESTGSLLVFGESWRTVADDGRWLAPVATPEQVAALTAERDDLAAELAAARGEDIGEWECVGDFYAPRDVEGACPVVEQHVDGVRWIPVALDGNDGEVWRGEPTGVLAAMRAACEAARGFGWTP